METMKDNAFLGAARGQYNQPVSGRPAQIPEAMTGLNDRTLCLREKICSLESRLSPILAPIPPTAANAKLEKGTEMVGIASYIYQQARNVAECIEAIDSILSRCEL